MRSVLLSLLILLPSLGQAISLKEGDFVKGEFISHQEADLYIQFPDKTTRLLAKNVQGEKIFLFKSEQQGEANFIAYKTGTSELIDNFTLNITQQIPLNDQKRLKKEEVFTHPLLQNIKGIQKDTSVFWQRIKEVGTPLIEKIDEQKSKVTFLYRGAKQNVKLFSDIAYTHDDMQQIAGTDIWYRSYILPNDARFLYKVAPDVPDLPVSSGEQRRAILATAQADLFNHYPYFESPSDDIKTIDKFNYWSSVTLSHAVEQPFVTKKDTLQGSIQKVYFESTILGNKRRVWIYLPKNFSKEKYYPILYLLDGAEYTQQVSVPTILDNMIAEHKIQPMVGVFIDTISAKTRAEELPANTQFAKALTEELIPFVEKTIQAKYRIISGSSYGGLASAYIAFNYPHLFPQALIMSGSFWWQAKESPPEENNYMAWQFAQHDKKPLCLFISAGRFEAGENSILASSRHLKDVLKAKHYPLIYKEYSAGHSYFSWQGVLSDGLIALQNLCL
ncbi:DUF3327 domain-containing protein [Pelistega sp. NLN82]|uniref:DUF3327 domain-containing protein n=1 Tax=Pelistega ratti TaxID=2652177 RepID=A0A6L9Y5N9_9BURK|nr:alpha/beta hydrolase-fold protein [Pelistega ratti]NEN75790.1 DUF3327 domain-containing protein [Pelistega ratti]